MKIKYKTYRPMSMAKVGDYVVPLVESEEANSPKGHARTVGKAYKVVETSSSWVRMGLENGVKDGNGAINRNQCRFATEEEIQKL